MKYCPKCEKAHNKPGKYCSRNCANSRMFSTDSRKRISESLKEYFQTEKGVAHKSKLGLGYKSEITKKRISENSKRLWKNDDFRKKVLFRLSNRKPFSAETKQKLSVIAKARGFGGNTSKKRMNFLKSNGEYVYLQSSYEVKFAEILEKLGITWERPKHLIWIDESNSIHRYYPDFKIGEIYIDVKNDYLAIKDFDKIEMVRNQNNIDLRIVTFECITEEYISSLV